MITLKGQLNTRKVWLDGKELSPTKSQKVWNHSPDGFAWGYGGSGPAQLALAILLELYSEERAVKEHQQFKWDNIARLPQDDFEIDLDLRIEIHSIVTYSHALQGHLHKEMS